MWEVVICSLTTRCHFIQKLLVFSSHDFLRGICSLKLLYSHPFIFTVLIFFLLCWLCPDIIVHESDQTI